MLIQNLDYAIIVRCAGSCVKFSAWLSGLLFDLIKIPDNNGLVLGSGGEVVVGWVDCDASDPLGVAVGKRGQAVARKHVPVLNGLVARTR